MSSVASPPSSRIMFGPSASGHIKACLVHHQYSSSVSPFHAKTGTPCGSCGVPSGPTAMAAAASSWVEKMLQEAQRTSAPSTVRVSMSTAVCTVMCRDPVMRAPRNGLLWPYWSRMAMRPGISCSARRIWSRPAAARERSATLKSIAPVSQASCRGTIGGGIYRSQAGGQWARTTTCSALVTMVFDEKEFARGFGGAEVRRILCC